jgi:acyl transferase domain-containing protein/acyl carrier protein
MAADLYREQTGFRSRVDDACELLLADGGSDLRPLLLAADDRPEAALELAQTAVAQPALFVVEYALAGLLGDAGVKPAAMLGHSVGEYVAATLAGVFTWEEALRLVVARGRLIQSLAPGGMLAVSLSEADLTARLDPALSLAAVNGSSMSVASGPEPAIEELERQLAHDGIACSRLHTSHAFHSAMTDPILAEFEELVRDVAPRVPTRPYVSNLTGTWITDRDAADPSRWALHLRQTVRFADGLAALLEDAPLALVEVGPGRALSGLAEQHEARRSEHVVASLLLRPGSSGDAFATTLAGLGRLWAAGATVDWRPFHADGRRRRCPLPSYPFERQRYWVDPVDEADAPSRAGPGPPSRLPPGRFWTPQWERAPRDGRAADAGLRRVLAFLGHEGFGNAIVELLREAGHTVVTALPGDTFSGDAEGGFTLDPSSPDHLDRLFQALVAVGQAPERILYALGLAPVDPSAYRVLRFDEAEHLGLRSLLELASALARNRLAHPMELAVLTNGVHDVTGREPLAPERSMVGAACRTIGQEFRNIRCRTIDVVLPAADAPAHDRLAAALALDLSTPGPGVDVAYRQGRRLALRHHPARLTAPDSELPLRRGGTYLVTGGLGNLGLLVAGFLAEQAEARLVLVGRSPFPSARRWDAWLAAHEAGDATARRIGALRAMEAHGASVLVARGDVADPASMQRVIESARNRFGAVHGVVHAAGDMTAGSFFEIGQVSAERIDRNLRPKARGLIVLHRLLRSEPIELWLLVSSISTVLGGLGLSAYAAANAYLEAFAQAQRRRSTAHWVTIALDACQLDSEPRPGDALGPTDVTDAIARVLGQARPHAVVSVTDLDERIRRWIEPAPASAPARPDAKARAENADADALAELFREVLGIDPVGADQDFFADLGGDSLLATQLASRIRARFSVELPLRVIFDSPTPGRLARALEDLAAAPASSAATSEPAVIARTPRRIVLPLEEPSSP